MSAKRTGELWVLMHGHRLGLGRNPLRRRSDRIETVLLWCALVAALLLIPVGAAVGTSVRNASDASAAQQRAALYEVKARTLAGTERSVPSAPGDVLSRVRVGYVDQHGVAREGTATVVIGTQAGTDVTVWLDQSGAIASAPRSASDGAAFGATVGLLVVLSSWLLLWGAFWLARIPLDRGRSEDWEDEWRSIAPRWSRGQT